MTKQGRPHVFETSAKEDVNVNECMEQLCRELFFIQDQEPQPPDAQESSGNCDTM